MRLRPVLFSVVLVLVVAGCSSDDTNTEAAAETTAPPSTTGTSFVEAAVDSLYLAFETTDPNAAEAVFTEDGVYVDKNGGEWIGRSGMAHYVEAVGPGISRCVRVGKVEARDDGSFTFPVEFTYNGVDYDGQVAVTMADDLIVRHDWAS